MSIETQLKTQIIGQSQALHQLQTGLESDELPKSFLFIGPENEEQIETIKALSQITNRPIKYLNAQDYQGAKDLSALLGKSYRNDEIDPHYLFHSLITNPKQILIINNLNQIGLEFQMILMQALDQGIIKDNYDRQINVHSTIFIGLETIPRISQPQLLTNNKLYQNVDPLIYSQILTDTSNLPKPVKARKTWQLALLKRFKQIVNFESINYQDYLQIVSLRFNQLAQQISTKYNQFTIKPTYISDLTNPPKFIKDLASKTFDTSAGTRPADENVLKLIEKKIDQSLAHNETIIDFNH